jgi:hypothetical protein
MLREVRIIELLNNKTEKDYKIDVDQYDLGCDVFCIVEFGGPSGGGKKSTFLLLFPLLLSFLPFSHNNDYYHIHHHMNALL